MEIKIEFENKHDLIRFTTLLKRFHGQLEEIKYNYCCDEILFDDMAIIDSVYQQLKQR